VAAVTALVAWGVLAFGAVYQWAYWPLMGGTAAASVWLLYRNRSARRPTLVVWTGALTFAAILLQLAPLPPSVLTAVSEPSTRILNDQNLLYGTGAIWHPVSIDPSDTAAAAGFLATMWLFALALAGELGRSQPPSRTSRRGRHAIPLSTLCRNIVVLAAAVAAVALCQAATFNGRIYWFWMPQGGSTNIFGPFVNRNHFAGWMVLATCLGGGYLGAQIASLRIRQTAGDWRRSFMWLESPEGTRVALATAAMAMMGVAVLWSLSRSGIIAYAAGMAVLVAASGRIQPGRRLAALLTVLGAGAILWRDTGVLAYWFGRSETLAWRMALWKDSIAPLRDFGLLGSGLNTYERVMLAYPLQHPSINPVHAHNEYLQTAIEGGLLVVVPFALLLVALAREVVARARDEQSVERYWIRVGAIAGLIAMAVQAGADFSIRLPGVALLVAVLLAIAIHRAPLRTG
jgi:O-antigen ligase